MRLFDKDFDLTKQLYQKLSHQNLVNDQIFNSYVWSAAHFDKTDLVESLISSNNNEIDLQIYFKCSLSQYDQKI